MGNPTKEDDMALVEYDSKIDSKKRITLRNALFNFYLHFSYIIAS